MAPVNDRSHNRWELSTESFTAADGSGRRAGRGRDSGSSAPHRCVSRECRPPDPGCEVSRSLQLLDVWVGDGAGPPIGPCARRLAPHQRLGLAHVERALDDLLGPDAPASRAPDQGAGMAGREAAVLDQLLDRRRQRQQPQRVGDVAAALADRLAPAPPGCGRTRRSAGGTPAPRPAARGRRAADSRSARARASPGRTARGRRPAPRAGPHAAPHASAARRRRSRSPRHRWPPGRTSSGCRMPRSRIDCGQRLQLGLVEATARLQGRRAQELDRHALRAAARWLSAA